MNPDMMYLHRDSGFLNIAYFKFDIDDQSGTQQITVLTFFKHCEFDRIFFKYYMFLDTC